MSSRKKYFKSYRTFAKSQNKQSSAFFEFSKAPLLHKEGLGWLKK
jgi:hypothetical protein